MGSLKPGKTIVYENDGNTVYGRYQGEAQRWVVGTTVDSQRVLDYNEWQDMMEMAQHNPNLKSLIDKALNTYRLMKQ